MGVTVLSQLLSMISQVDQDLLFQVFLLRLHNKTEAIIASPTRTRVAMVDKVELYPSTLSGVEYAKTAHPLRDAFEQQRYAWKDIPR